MHIRLMQFQDIPAVVKIEQQVQFHPWKTQQFLDSLENYQCTVLEQHGQIVGFCIMQPVLDEANLLLMAIDPQYQRQGLAFQLLSEAIERLGEKCVQIFLEVRESNRSAIALYEKTEFHQIDKRKNYYPAPNGKKEDAVIMVKTLNAEGFGFQL